MRVISGSAKARKLVSPGEATRPITDRVKENLFNILSTEAIDADVLDLFAGAGSVGIEALSRGARHATFIEKDRDALRALTENLRLTGLAAKATVIKGDAFKFIRTDPASPFDLIYVAPPQYHGMWSKTMRMLEGRSFLSPEGVLVVQIHPKEYEPVEMAGLELTDERKYGSTLLLFYRPISPTP